LTHYDLFTADRQELLLSSLKKLNSFYFWGRP